MPPGKTNRLATEKSPYLLEHARNPVDWYPWGKEAFAKAKNDNKPILLSIGYSTCHWCHVLARESFEDDKTASFINKNFIPIKVDREERPEVDAYYMGAVQAMTGGGGWPLTAFLTPDLKAFYGGTYFPPEPRYGMPSFMQVLEFVAKLWKERREDVRANTERVLKVLAPEPSLGAAELSDSTLDEGYSSLVAASDPEHGGFGRAPKFPLPNSLAYLLRYHHRTGKELALSTVLKALDEMLAGGIRDHVGGGFHRYSTDRVWLVPHFEKMLYDNALLASVYAEAYQITRREEYADVARETLNWITGEMRSKEGGFYSAQDADTAEGEGVFYTWTPEEVEAATGARDSAAVQRLYGVTRTGNFEGRTILRLRPGVKLTLEDKDVLARSRLPLYRARGRRPRPATDIKVLTSWNGLAISALAFSSRVLGDQAYADRAAEAADFVLQKLSEDGRLLRRYAGGEAGLEGTLEDYAFFIKGLVDLFETVPEAKWLREAIRLARGMVEKFEDKKDGGFFLTTTTEPARLKESYDGPTPSGNSVAMQALLRVAELTGDEEFRRAAERSAKHFAAEVERNPTGHTAMLSAVDLVLNGFREIVISARTKETAQPMEKEVSRFFLPDTVLLVVTNDGFGELSKMSSLLEGRRPGPRARAFVCKNFTCNLPADTVDKLRSQIAALRA